MADQLVVTNTTSDVFEVLDDDGTAFLRIGPDGVHANISSPGWYQTNNPFGLSKIPDTAKAGAPEDWKKVAAEPSWGWFDHRLHPQGLRPPPQMVEAGEPGEFAQWLVPVRWRGKDARLTGKIVYRPIRGSIVAELTQPPEIPDLDLAVLQGRVPGFFLDNRTGDEVVVLGRDGEPFLRFTRNAVQANLHSPAWLAARRAEGGDLSDVIVDPELPPQWRRVSDAPRFGWVDPRAGYPDEEPAEEVVAERQPVELLTWEIPLKVGGEEAVAAGVTTWQPAPGSGADETGGGLGVPSWVRPVAVGAALLALLWLLARRRTPATPEGG